MRKVRVAVQLSSLAAAIASGVLACGSSNPAASDPSWTQVAEKTAYELTLKGTCYRGTRDGATRLHDDLATLMVSYYRRPFPK